MSLLPRNAKILEYKILDHLGSGGFANTYGALDTNLDKKVAIKEFFPARLCCRGADYRVQPLPDREAAYRRYLANYIEEARILAKFDQPNIVKVLRYFEALGTAFIIMEFVDGRPIGEYFAFDRVLGEDRVGRWLDGLLSGLAAVHDANVIHGDIKPLNIIINQDDEAVLIDFGAAAVYRSPLAPADISDERHLSPNYAAPEQFAGTRDLDHRLDLYSLGAVFYEAVTGEKLIEARRRGTDIGRELQRYRKYYNAKLLTSVARAVADDPGARFANAQQWRDHIVLSPAERLAAAYRRHRVAVAAGVALAAVLAGAGVAVEQHDIDARNYRYKLFASTAEIFAKIRQGEEYREKLRDALSYLGAYQAEYAAQVGQLDPQFLVTGRINLSTLTGATQVIAETRRRLEAADRELTVLQEKYYFDAYAEFLVGTERVIQDFSSRQATFNRALLRAYTEHQIMARAKAGGVEVDRVALNDLMTRLAEDSEALALGDLVSVSLPIVEDFLAAQRRKNATAALAALREKTVADIKALAERYRKNSRYREFAGLVDAAMAAERRDQVLASRDRAAELAREIDRERAAAAARRARLQRQSELRSFVAAIDRDMIRIEPGTFRMGSREHGYSQPPRVVDVRPFYLLKNEVVNAQWDECVKDGKCRARAQSANANYPVTGVSWDEVQAFIAWLNDQAGRFTYRLPTEAEWEYVVRTYGYVGKELGSDLSSVAVAQTNNRGINSIVGNALEWLDDCWHGGFVGAPADSRSWDRGLQCDLRVVRGSNWRGEYDIGAGNVAYYRPFGIRRTESRPTLGFRLAGDLKQ